MNATTSYAGYVRRIDARLRSIHPNLVTQIYEVETNRFVITFDSALEDASAISDEFDNSIRFMTVAVTLSNMAPVNYLREISPLSDAEASGNMAGLMLRAIDLLNLLVSRFPDAGIISVQDVPIDRTIILILQKAPDVATESQLVEFVDSFDWPLKVKIETRPGQLPEGHSRRSKSDVRVGFASKKPSENSYCSRI